MESAEYSLDELLCQSLLLFRQYRFYDAPECGEKAFRILEEAHVWMGRTQECVDMAKWGCVIECLAQKYYIEDDTDAILEEIDAALVAHWEEDRENPCRSHHRLFMAGVLFPATFQKPGIPFPFPL